MKDMISQMLVEDLIGGLTMLALMGLIILYVVERWTFIPRRKQRERFHERF